MLRKILIVDDSSINRELLHKILCCDYDILEAKNGELAVSVLRQEYNSISAVLLDLVMPVMDGYEVLSVMRDDPNLANIPVIVTTSSNDESVEVKALSLGANDFIPKPYNALIIKHRLWNTINLRETAAYVNTIERDKLTGLYNRETFFSKVEEMTAEHEPGYYVMSCFDIHNFKYINDQYGSEKGDNVLKQLAKIFLTGFKPLDGICSRITSDKFAILYPASLMDSCKLASIHHEASILDGSMRPISFGIGRYIVTDTSLSGSAMYDRAIMAEASVKARFGVKIANYNETMRENIIREQEIINEMRPALESGQFHVWLQPQYNHSSGALIGAEALVRCVHPEKGIISPDKFIPVFERNGFIYEMDKSIWEQTCALLKGWIVKGQSPLPISINVSRYDIFQSDFFDFLTGLVKRYDIPLTLLKLEITESAFAKSSEQIIQMVKRLIHYGFVVEIDDFGSGYSSLNTLKDVPASVLKLDMRFLEDNDNSSRGGNILESIIRMAKWLGMPVIAEGVETIEQADYLKSIGCFYVQGFLYAKPMPVSKYVELEACSTIESEIMALETFKNLDNNAFWNPKSMETLMFNSYVGGASIFEYNNGVIELLRVNEKYARELFGEDAKISTALSIEIIDYMDDKSREAMLHCIDCAVSSGDEETCELKLSDLPNSPGLTYIRITLRLLAKAGNRTLFYSTVYNITAQRTAEQHEREISQQMQTIMANINGGVSAVTFDNDVAHFIFANDNYFSLYGYTKDQFFSELPRGVFNIVHPDDKDKIIYSPSKCTQPNGKVSTEFRAYKRDGRLIWVRSTVSICNIDGIEKPVYVFVSSDITKEKETELHILSLNENLQNLMDDTPGGFARIKFTDDGSFKIVYFNEGFRKLLNMNHDEIMLNYGSDVLTSIHSDDIRIVRSAINDIISTGKTHSAKYRLKRKDGDYVSIEVFGRLVKNAVGEKFFNIYFNDVSESEIE